MIRTQIGRWHSFFIDAKKAFDNLTWPFMFQVMEKLKLGENFCNAVAAIYKEQTAKIRINNELTRPIKILKGTRQGCPLSPLLFIMTLEVLFREVREDERVKGLRHKGFRYKLRAFADDVVFITEDPISPISYLTDKINEFGILAGFYLNKAKSKILCKNMTLKRMEELAAVTECEIVKKFKYLGIEVTQKNLDLFSNNYEKLWLKIEKDLVKWKSLKLSLLGRVALIKMSVLLKLTFLFQTIPIVKEKKTFDNWQRKIMRFIWLEKKPRVKLKIMIDEQKRGGLQVPHLELYHDAAALMWIKEWLTLQNKKMLNLEGSI